MELQGYYQFDCIYASPDSLVYRALRQQDNAPVIIRLLNREHPSATDVAKARREYEILRKIDLEGVIKAHEIVPYGRGNALVLEDFGAISLNAILHRGLLPLHDTLRIGITLADILGHLHQQGIIHRDIKPASIVINEQDGRIKLIDFKISSLISGTRQQDTAPDHLEGTLAYIAPEQTGRINRGVDHRADLYSLGITLYEMLTGSLPFAPEDALELVHCQIAVMPEPVWRRRPDVAQPLSDIVMRLLAKDPDQRYRSGFGLRLDLERCLIQLEKTGTITPFPLGREDGFTFFRIPDKLYGRERELSLLNTWLQKAAAGQRRLVLVSGSPGIGKTALIREAIAVTSLGNVLFASGKFDQFQRDKPYSGLIQAFSGLGKQLLGETSQRLSAWAERLNHAWGVNGRIITELIPEFELIGGKQNLVEELPSLQGSNRFQHVFKEFVRALAVAQHPLILFLDDLQWADPATLKLLESLLTEPEQASFLCIGAFRDNEVGPEHPLRFMLESLQKSPLPIEHVVLEPLSRQGVVELIRDAFMLDQQNGEAFGDIVMERTMGNPFFVLQYLQTLHQDGLLYFDPAGSAWNWDAKRIKQSQAMGNVVDFLCAKIDQLAPDSLELLEVAACIGNSFSLAQLAGAWERNVAKTAVALEAILQAGFLLPLDESYKYAAHMVMADEAAACRYVFLHDRVQQAAYSLLASARKEELHHRIGSLAWHSRKNLELEEQLFSIVDHLNIGVARMTTRSEKLELARLNLRAGKKAKDSAAYLAAIRYLNRAMTLLPDQSWEQEYDLSLAVYLEMAESEYLAGDFATAKDLLAILVQHARSKLEKAKVHRYRVILYQLQGAYLQALAAGREGLRLLGYHLPENPGKIRVICEVIRLKRVIGKRGPDDLLHLPVMDDPEKKAITALLVDMVSSAYYAGSELYSVVTLAIVAISVRHGNTKGSAIGYTGYGIILGSGLGEYRSGYEYGQMAIELSRRSSDLQSESVTYFVMAGMLGHWRQPLAMQPANAEKGYQAGFSSGNFVYAGYSLGILHPLLFSLGRNLDDLSEEYAKYLAILRKINHQDMVYAALFSRQAIRALQGLTESPLSLNDKEFDEQETVDIVVRERGKMILAIHDSYKLFLAFVFGDYHQAHELATGLDALAEHLLGQFQSVWPVFFSALSMAGLYQEANQGRRLLFQQRLGAHLKKMKKWQENCPENFSQFVWLMEAELARITGKRGRAMTFYGRAIDAARTNGFLHYEAIAHELAGRFFLEDELKVYASYHLREARYCYQRWGAIAKVKNLEELFPWAFQDTLAERSDLLANPLLRSYTGPTTSNTPLFDVHAVIRATQEISGEVKLASLLEKLMGTVLANAGADLGLLILLEDDQFIIRTQGSLAHIKVILEDQAPLADKGNLAMSVLNYSARSMETVVLEDAGDCQQFAADPYIITRKPRSLLCVPISRQGKLVGILYLENSLTPGVFTAGRVALLNMLAAQMAISLENALLYANLEKKVAQRTRDLENALQEIRHLSNTDPLTSIPNRRHFFEQFQKEWDRARRYNRPLAFVMLDIDHFKEINDKWGHQTGDEVLKQLAGLIVTMLRRVDYVARLETQAATEPVEMPGQEMVGRLGGEEFALLLPETSFAGAEVVSEKLRAGVENATFLDSSRQHRVVVTVSIGCCCVEKTPCPDMNILYCVADQCLYRSKQEGRNRVTCTIYSP